MKIFKPAFFLMHMVTSCRKILEQSNVSFDVLMNDENRQAVIERKFEILGEAADKLIKSGYAKQHVEIPWQLMKDFRNLIIHEYFSINYRQMWKIVKEDVPVVLDQLEKLPEFIIAEKHMRAYNALHDPVALTGQVEPAEQAKELRRQVQILFQERCLQSGVSSAKWDNMTIPELVDLLLTVPEKERGKFISPREQYRAPEQQEPSPGIDL